MIRPRYLASVTPREFCCLSIALKRAGVLVIWRGVVPLETLMFSPTESFVNLKSIY